MEQPSPPPRPRRVRQHVNPLNFTVEVERVDWSRAFPEPARRLEVEIGPSKGTFLIARARAGHANLVGLETPGPMCEALSDREAAHLARGDPVYRYLFVRRA